MAKIALTLKPERIWDTLHALGFGQSTGSGFPGESSGTLSNYSHWRPVGIATLSHGYGIAVTSLQLAHAFATIGALGLERPISLKKISDPVPGVQVIPRTVAQSLRQLMEQVVVAPGATGRSAAIIGYHVAGKTGTAWKSIDGEYRTDKITAVFGGVAPASHPHLAMIVVIDEPSGGLHRGVEVAPPVFSM
jgi:cell division protein FtsI (penicillin-binding protein 3)